MSFPEPPFLRRRRLKNPQKIEPDTLIMNTILDRLSENSTWRGLILLLTSLGVSIQPALHEYIIAGGLAIVGIINVLRKEKKP